MLDGRFSGLYIWGQTFTEHVMPKLLTEEEAAAELNCSASWLQKQRLHGEAPPPYHRLGKLIRYERDTLIAWARSFDSEGNYTGENNE